MNRPLLLLTAALFVAALSGPAFAAPEDVANAVSNEIMSPYCDGVTLHDCPSDSAIALRDRIKDWAEQGWSKQRIITKLSSPEEFGSDILASPPNSGIGLFAWLLPLLAVLIGGALLWRLLSRWTGGPPPPVEAISDEDHQRVESEMSKFRTAR
jgi:cytochrome c-type biogenesis protein CcmH